MRKRKYLATLIRQGRRKQMDIGGGAGNSENLGESGGMHPQIILKSRTVVLVGPFGV